MKDHIRCGDCVAAIDGPFKGKRGWVSKINGHVVCVVWDDMGAMGTWVPLLDLKRQKITGPRRGGKTA